MSDEEMGADTLPNSGATTQEPFPNLRRGFKKHVENSRYKPEAGVEHLHTQPYHQVLHRPCGVSKLEAEAEVWPIRPIPHQDHPRINGPGGNRQELTQVPEQDAQIRNHFFLFTLILSQDPYQFRFAKAEKGSLFNRTVTDFFSRGYDDRRVATSDSTLELWQATSVPPPNKVEYE